ncbi:hypothetical protein [Lacticaseibacillus manihotivorans]|uniref:hypothetical protein n=1 Tax=Lacticaseibacillus manihotivorans TaxID=88233 RepID=UPI0006D2A8BC|nr:hypothetical protein [Lacticaseibacillus manihotivorans]
MSLYSLDPKPGSAAAKKPNRVIDGKGVQNVESQGDTKVLSASTYKLYIAAYVFHRLEKKQMSWTLTDKQNFDAMIVNSENGFAQTILTRYGNDTVDKYLQSIGLGQPFSGDSAETTANQLVKVLQMLDAGNGPFKNKALRAVCSKTWANRSFATGSQQGSNPLMPKPKCKIKWAF